MDNIDYSKIPLSQQGIFRASYNLFYDFCNAVERLMNEGDDGVKNYVEDKTYVFGKFISKFGDILEEGNLLEGMVSRVKELNEKGAGIFISGLDTTKT